MIKKEKRKKKHSVVSSPRNHLSTILPTIPLYDFPSLSLDMRTTLYNRANTLVYYYIQHRQEPIDRHLLSPSSLGLLQIEGEVILTFCFVNSLAHPSSFPK